MRLFYNVGIYLLDAGLHVAGLFNEKARLWCHGRRGIFRRMAETVQQNAVESVSHEAENVSQIKQSGQTVTGAHTEEAENVSNLSAENQVIWFHCASLGEFEQGRPVIEAFRAAHPDWKILLTFFSPSGYEVRKNYSGADFIFYLPADTPRNVRRFMAIFRPKIAVFVKYEFWANYLFALQRSGAKCYLVSGIFREGQSFSGRGAVCFERFSEHLIVSLFKMRSLCSSWQVSVSIGPRWLVIPVLIGCMPLRRLPNSCPRWSNLPMEPMCLWPAVPGRLMSSCCCS